MSSLVHPRGPEPERTYWIRRGIVVVALLVTLWVFVAILRTLFGHGSATAGPVVSPNPSSLAGSPMVTPTDTGTPSAGASSASASASASTSVSSASASSSPSQTPSSNGVCSASQVGVDLTAAPDSLAPGSSTQLQVKLTNNAGNPCRINFAQTPLRLAVTSGVDHIWSNSGCTSWAPRGMSDEVKPGTAWTFSQTWSTKRSGQGCVLRDGQLRPGTYVASASLGGQAASRIISLHS